MRFIIFSLSHPPSKCFPPSFSLGEIWYLKCNKYLTKIEWMVPLSLLHTLNSILFTWFNRDEKARWFFKWILWNNSGFYGLRELKEEKQMLDWKISSWWESFQKSVCVKTDTIFLLDLSGQFVYREHLSPFVTPSMSSPSLLPLLFFSLPLYFTQFLCSFTLKKVPAINSNCTFSCLFPPSLRATSLFTGTCNHFWKVTSNHSLLYCDPIDSFLSEQVKGGGKRHGLLPVVYPRRKMGEIPTTCRQMTGSFPDQWWMTLGDEGFLVDSGERERKMVESGG